MKIALLALVASAGAATALTITPAPRSLTVEAPHTPQVSSPKVGVAAPAFTAVDTRGKSHTLSAYRGKWVVLEWFNHDCPYTRKHYDTGNTQSLQKDFTKRGVIWLSVVSSAPGKEGFKTGAVTDQLTTEKGATPTAVVRDTSGVLGHLYGARNTPQYAIIDPTGVLRYAGAIDDKPSTKTADIAGATNYVREALDAGLSGRPIVMAQTQPYGCTVQY